MQPDSSKSAAPKRHRKFTPKFKAKVLAYYAEHGHNETLKKYRLSGSTFHRIRVQANGHAAPEAKASQARRIPMQQFALARKLKAAVRQRLRETADIDDADIYAMLLTRAILKERQ
jgi:transposase-like protein